MRAAKLSTINRKTINL